MSAVAEDKFLWVAFTFRIYFIGLCLLSSAVAVDSLSRRTPTAVATDNALISIYIFFFAVLLFVFEASQFHSVAWVDDVYVKNFGFMFKPISKSIFLSFVGLLMFGLDATHGNRMGYAAGFLLIIGAVALTAVFLKDKKLLIPAPEPYRPPDVAGRTAEV